MNLLISSGQNPRIKQLVRLRDRKARDEAGLVLIEGYHELEMAVSCGIRPTELYYCAELVRPEELGLLAKLIDFGAEVVEVTTSVMAKAAYRDHPDAWLALAKVPVFTLESLAVNENTIIIVAEAVEKPGNLGAILRTADAVGASSLIVCDRATDIYNPNVVRASKGAVFSVKVVETSSAETILWLKAQGVAIVAATPSAKEAHWDADLRGPVAIAVGTEKEGLSTAWFEAADKQLLIPMSGRVNSLNVAQAASLILYEVVRQRRETR